MNLVRIKEIYNKPYEVLKRLYMAKYACFKPKKYGDPHFRLTQSQENAVKAFYKPYGGCKVLFHRFYTEKTGRFSPYYLPTDIYLNEVDAYFNDRAASFVMDNKCFYSQFFADIPQPDTVALRINGFWFDVNRKQLSAEQLQAVLNEEEAVFVKVATSSMGGKGVFYISADDGDVYHLMMQQIASVRTDIVIQRPLRQHPALNTINESSVNTIRILSLLTEEGVKIYSAVLRMGIDGSKVDNASSGGITCGITEDGKLKEYAYKTSGERLTVHPTSGVVFEGYTIPHFEAAKQLVEKAHPLVPHFRMVSWDVAIDENGDAVMIEANLSQGGLNSHQFSNGPLFGEDTPKILDEVFSRRG